MIRAVRPVEVSSAASSKGHVPIIDAVVEEIAISPLPWKAGTISIQKGRRTWTIG